MEFKEINKTNNFSMPTSTKKKDVEKQVIEKKEVVEEKKESPNNPTYWQNTAGIKINKPSFKGENENTSKIIDDYLNCIKEQPKYNEFFDKNLFKKNLEEVALSGDKSLLAYMKLMRFGLNFFHSKQKLENYENLCKEISKEFSCIEGNAQGYSPFLALLSQRKGKEEYSQILDYLKEILSDNKAGEYEKFLWINKKVFPQVFSINSQKFDAEKINESYQAFTRFFSLFEENSDKSYLSKFDITKEELEKASEMIETGEIDEEDIVAYFNSFSNIFSGYKKIPAEIINDLYENREKQVLFSSLAKIEKRDKQFQGELIYSLLKSSNAMLLNEFIAILMSKIKNEDDEKAITNNIIKQMSELISRDNIDTLFDNTKGGSVSDVINTAKKYKNPITGFYDSKIQEKEAELISKGLDEYSALGIVQTGIDSETGKFSPIADELLDYIYFTKDKHPLKSKLMQFASNFSKKARGFIQLKQYITEQELSDLLDCLKDINGRFDKVNLQYLKKLLNINNSHYDISDNAHLMNAIKDKNGIVDKNKYEKASVIYQNCKDVNITRNIMTTLNKYSDDKQEEIFKTCTSFNCAMAKMYKNFESSALFCFDENGNFNQEHYDIAKSFLTKINYHAIITPEFYEIIQSSDDNKQFAYQLLEQDQNDTSMPSFFVYLHNKLKTKENEFPDDIKDKMINYAKSTQSLYGFFEVYNVCNSNENFDRELFDKILELKLILEISNKTTYRLTANQCKSLINKELKLQDIKFKEKVELLNTLKDVKKYVDKNSIVGYEYLEKAITDIDSSLSLENIALPVNNGTKINFISNVMNSKSKTELSLFEKTILNSVPELEKMTEGLKISYSREEFLSDLSKICTNRFIQEIIQQKTGINLIIENDEITGYNGIIKLDELDTNNQIEKQIYDCMYRFMYENTVITDNKELNEQLNYIIKAFPEFINIIGKKQHGTHKYTIDIHSLLVLAYSIKAPDYLEKLNPVDRSILKISTIFHDLMKEENVVDKGHQNLSSLYARSIVDKLIKNPETKDRIYEIIDNHHWLEEISTTSDIDKKTKELAFRFRRPNDFELSKIMARSDLMAVNPSFYENKKSALDDSNIEKIQQNLNYLYHTGNVLLTDRIILPSKLNNYIEKKDGKEYKVINFHKISDDEDLGKYGFRIGLTKKDARFLIHMINSNTLYNDLNTVKLLSTAINGGVLSESIISPRYKSTYLKRKYGVLLSQNNTNIVNEAKSNQTSGTQKEFSNLMDLIFKNDSNKRTYFREKFLEKLQINPENISDEEYGVFYKEHLASKHSLSEFQSSKEYKLGKYTITGEKLKTALKDYQDSLIDKVGMQHNEIVGYAPKIEAVIAKENSLNNLPDDLLKFAEENNLPIVLI